MPRVRLNAKQINEQKWKRMRLIIEGLKEKPLSISEIEYLVFDKRKNPANRRTLQNYLAELRALKLVTYDPSRTLYLWTDYRKVLSRTEYQIALKHSRHLLLTDPRSDIQRLDMTEPSFALNLIVFPDETMEDQRQENSILNSCLLQHIKTGYHEMYSLIEKYKRLMVDLGYADLNRIPILTSRILGHPEKENAPSESLDLSYKEYLKNQKEKHRKEQELLNLREQLIGKLYSLVAKVKDNSPLLGLCDNCPRRTIKIKE